MNIRQYLWVPLQQLVNSVIMQRLEDREHLDIFHQILLKESTQSPACFVGFQPLMIDITISIQRGRCDLCRIRTPFIPECESGVIMQEREGERLETHLRPTHLAGIAADGIASELRIQQRHECAFREIIHHTYLMYSRTSALDCCDVWMELLLDRMLMIESTILGASVLEDMHWEVTLLEQLQSQKRVLASTIAAQYPSSNLSSSMFLLNWVRGTSELLCPQKAGPMVGVYVVLVKVLGPGTRSGEGKEIEGCLRQAVCDQADVKSL